MIGKLFTNVTKVLHVHSGSTIKFCKESLGNIYGADYMKTINQHKILRKSSHILHVNAIYMAILNSNRTAMFEFYCNDFRRVIIP